MKFRWQRALTVASREYVTTVSRKAFVLTLIGTPLFYSLIMVVMIKPQIDESIKAMRAFRAMGVVDSSGLFAAAPDEIRTQMDVEAISMRKGTPGPKPPPEAFVTKVLNYAAPESALAALERGDLKQVLVIPPDYLAHGRVRRYVGSENVFNDGQQERPVQRWLTRGLLAGRVDSTLGERASRPTRAMDVYTLNREGAWEHRDDSSQVFEFLVPFIAGLLLSMSIVIGGQYLLQGVSEEKESRILESMLCTLTPEDLVVGKLLGLGGAGLTLVGSWALVLAAFSGTAALASNVSVSPVVLVLMVAYFLLGYLFYASLMTGIGAITNNMREAQGFSFMFTFMNFIPFYMMTTLVGHPEAPLSVGLSLFPPTAPVSMLLRVASPSSHVPAWQIALSLALLAGTAYLALRAAAKIFRIGLLLYGKTPTLPEIVRWLRAS